MPSGALSTSTPARCPNKAGANNLKKDKKTDKEIKQGIKDKLFWMIEKKELYLYLGTMKQMHGWTSILLLLLGFFTHLKIVDIQHHCFRYREELVE
jgi:hypothetical protein